MDFIISHSFILHAVTISTPARAARGILDMTPPSRNIDAIIVIEWKTLTSLVWPPAFMATLVLAIAAVAGTPPRKGITIFPIPCAISSLEASIFSFFIFPADAPHKRLSIIPSAAILAAGVISTFTDSNVKADSISLFSRRSVFGIAPTSDTSKSKIICITSAIIMLASEDGNLAFNFLGYRSIIATTITPNITA